MNFSILTRESIGNNNWFIEIEFFPENETESMAIHNFETGNANESEIELLENHLHASLKGMSLLNLVRHKKSVFAVTAADLPK